LYGFTVSGDGLGTATVNVGANGAAFGVADNTVLAVMDVLLAADTQAVDVALYSGDATRPKKANAVFSAINQAGGSRQAAAPPRVGGHRRDRALFPAAATPHLPVVAETVHRGRWMRQVPGAGRVGLSPRPRTSVGLTPVSPRGSDRRRRRLRRVGPAYRGRCALVRRPDQVVRSFLFGRNPSRLWLRATPWSSI
jgi:hypothetical protein